MVFPSPPPIPDNFYASVAVFVASIAGYSRTLRCATHGCNVYGIAWCWFVVMWLCWDVVSPCLFLCTAQNCLIVDDGAGE